jgi:hypothetical protein
MCVKFSIAAVSWHAAGSGSRAPPRSPSPATPATGGAGVDLSAGRHAAENTAAKSKKSGSQSTRRWREIDSNFRYRVRCKGGLVGCRRWKSPKAGQSEISEPKPYCARNRKFESISLQRSVCKPSVPASLSKKNGVKRDPDAGGVIAGARTSRRNARDHRPLIEWEADKCCPNQCR